MRNGNSSCRSLGIHWVQDFLLKCPLIYLRRICSVLYPRRKESAAKLLIPLFPLGPFPFTNWIPLVWNGLSDPNCVETIWLLPNWLGVSWGPAKGNPLGCETPNWEPPFCNAPNIDGPVCCCPNWTPIWKVFTWPLANCDGPNWAYVCEPKLNGCYYWESVEGWYGVSWHAKI